MAAAVVLHLCRHWKLRKSTACSYHVIPHANAFQSLISLSRWAVGQSRWQKFDKVQFLILKGAKGASPRSGKSPLTHRLLQNNCLFRCAPRHCSSFRLGLYRHSSIPLEIALHVALLCSRTFSRSRSRTMRSPCLSWTRSRLAASFFLVSSSTIYGGYLEPKWYVISAGLYRTTAH